MSKLMFIAFGLDSMLLVLKFSLVLEKLLLVDENTLSSKVNYLRSSGAFPTGLEHRQGSVIKGG